MPGISCSNSCSSRVIWEVAGNCNDYSVDVTKERDEPEQWQYDHWKARDEKKLQVLEHRTKNRNCRTDRLLSTASTSTASRPSTWTTLLLRRKEIQIRTCSYCGTKTGKTMARCRPEMILNLQPDHLLWPATWKVEDIHTFLEVDDFDSDH